MTSKKANVTKIGKGMRRNLIATTAASISLSSPARNYSRPPKPSIRPESVRGQNWSLLNPNRPPSRGHHSV